MGQVVVNGRAALRPPPMTKMGTGPRGLPLRLRTINLFRRGARSDAALGALRRAAWTDREAFDRVYAQAPDHDPWASADRRHLYRQRKYEHLVWLLPPGRRFREVLDLGCGLGVLSERVAPRCDRLLGLDLSPTARARARAGWAGRTRTPALRKGM